jgi:hypothetical protein
MSGSIRTAAAAVIAAVAASGCTTTVEGQAQPRDSARAKTETSATSAPTAAAPEWVDVSGQGVELKLDWKGVQYGDQPYPGINIGQHQADGHTKGCTAGPLIRSIHDSGTGFLTAGHCDQTPGGQVFIFAAPSGSQPVLVGTYAGALDNDISGQDSAALWTTVSAIADATRIAGRFPIIGFMPETDVRNLLPGTPVCLDGARSGVKCTTLRERPSDKIRFDEITRDGDSGAAVFVVDRYGCATLLGVLQGADGFGRDEATLIAPALDRLGAEVVTTS